MYGALPPPSSFARYPSINTSMVSRGSRPAASSWASPGSANVRASAMSRDALNLGGSRPARRARWMATSSSTLEGVGNAAPRSRTGAVLLAVVVTGGGCTVSPAWCRPESKGTETGARTGSTGCSQNEEVPPSAGVTMFPVSSRMRGRGAGDGGGPMEPPSARGRRLRRRWFRSGKARGGRTPRKDRGHPSHARVRRPIRCRRD